MPPRILISNDDGYDARGVSILFDALDPIAEVWVVAPDSEQSAASHSLTLRRPLAVKAVGPRRFRVSGTPTDCVVLALQVLLDPPPDLVVSGINHGGNLGEDVHYSGTVAAAFEGAILGVPGIALSALQSSVQDRATHAAIARRVVEVVLDKKMGRNALLNVNIPDPSVGPVRGVRTTRLGSRVYENFIDRSGESSSAGYYTIGGKDPVWRETEGADIAAVRRGFVSVTPLNLDMTDHDTLDSMERWRFAL